MNEVEINGKNVKVLGFSPEIVIKSVIFRNWVDQLSEDYNIVEIHSDSLDFLSNGEILFIKLHVVMQNCSGDIFSRSFVLRKDAVAILIVLECGKEQFVILVDQPRIPTGYSRFTEIPAGIIDSMENIVGAAIREVEEETGIIITKNDLVDIFAKIYGDKDHGIYLAPGLTNDNVRLFLVEKQITQAELSVICGRLAGAQDENEDIIVRVIPMESLAKETMDAKSLAAITLYHYYNSKKRTNLR